MPSSRDHLSSKREAHGTAERLGTRLRLITGGWRTPGRLAGWLTSALRFSGDKAGLEFRGDRTALSPCPSFLSAVAPSDTLKSDVNTIMPCARTAENSFVPALWNMLLAPLWNLRYRRYVCNWNFDSLNKRGVEIQNQKLKIKPFKNKLFKNELLAEHI